MTSKHPCGGDAVHAKFDQTRTTLEALSDEIAAAHRPAEKAGRALTPAEQARVDRTRAAFEDARTEMRKARREVEDHHLTRGCAPGTATGTRPTSHDPDQGSKTALMSELDAMLNRSAGLGGSGYGGAKRRDTRWSVKAFEQMGDRNGYLAPAKSLAAPGSVLVPSVLDGVPVREGERATSVLQVIPAQTLSGTDIYAFLRQTTRTNAARPVGRGRLKPTSVYKLERIEDRCRTIAHLSEAVAKQDLDDASDLAQFLDMELRYGLARALEDQVIAGTGQRPADDPDGELDLLGVLATPGTLAQPFTVDPFTTTRRAITRQSELGNTPSHWTMPASAWEGFELAREDGPASGGFVLGAGPVDRAGQRLWGLPVIVCDAVPEDVAILGDFSGSSRLYQREQAQVMWSDAVYRPAEGTNPASTAFSRNELVARAEQRTGFAITRPSAFAEVALAAGA